MLIWYDFPRASRVRKGANAAAQERAAAVRATRRRATQGYPRRGAGRSEGRGAMDWDADRVTTSDLNLRPEVGQETTEELSARSIRNRFREFFRNYREGNVFTYREALLAQWRRRMGFVEVHLAHVGEYDLELLQLLQERPLDVLPQMEKAASIALQGLEMDAGGEGADDEEEDGAGPEVQVVLKSSQHPLGLREITAQHVNKLLRVPGIIIAASRVRAKAVRVKCVCKTCGAEKHIALSGPFGAANLPPRCDRNGAATDDPNGDAPDCGLNPFVLLPDGSEYVDQQTLKLQESPEVVPTGEMPRNVLLSVDRRLIDRVPPGTRVSVLGVSCLFTSNARQKLGPAAAAANIRTPYLRVVGISIDTDGAGRAGDAYTPQQEEFFLRLSRNPKLYERIARSVAPSISGDYTRDIKRAIAVQLFGGSRKTLPDGVRLRGDVNVLLLGDPSTAKSQFLKFVEKVAPVGVYTSGKGSSAAGLTASVTRDSRGEFYLEGGAMVLADGGVVCIDEFDKMREQDRVAIHEAMEQQTISVAKAGITTVLNSRTSVLAAANPIFGRYDDLKSASENIDLMTTILSRFDLIFIVRDIRDEARDRQIARHVMSVHISAAGGLSRGVDQDDAAVQGPSAGAAFVPELSVADGDGELDMATLKMYVAYCRAKCAPRLSRDATEKLSAQYVQIREQVRQRTHELGAENNVVPITVRQLEALVRISEGLAKMRLEAEVSSEDVEEALRLFRVSTMAAATHGGGAADATFLRPEVAEGIRRAEEFVKSRCALHMAVNAKRLQEEAIHQGHQDFAVRKALAVMVSRGEFQEKHQGRLLRRVR